MKAFSVGDVLIGNELNTYVQTNKENPCVVVRSHLDDEGKIKVRVLSGFGVGNTWCVSPDRFNLVDSTPFEGNV